MLTFPKKERELPHLAPQLSPEKRFEQERLRDVFLLIENLAEREEVTIKLILDCLYDVGSVNLINKKFSSRPTNQIVKFIAKLAKPAFKVFALRWFKKNCPQLITNWLQSKVTF
jgi:hypothetical protein